MPRRTARVLVVALFAAIAVCSPQASGGPETTAEHTTPLAITGSCSASGVAVGGFVRNWACGDVVRLATPAGMTSGEVSALSSAVAGWNGAVLGAYGLPQFTMSAGNRTITVSISGAGDYYCGQVPVKTQLNIARFATASGCSHPGRLSTGTLGNLFLHELSHSVGFQSGVWHKPSTEAITGHCAGALYSAGRPLNSGVCQHEVEAIHAAYGLRSTAPDLAKHVLTGLAGLTSLSLSPGGTGTLTVSSLRFWRANGTLCGQPDTTACFGTASPSGASLSWSTSNAGVASLSGSGASRTVTGNAAGVATISVDATTPTYERAATFGGPGTGTAATVTVVAQPPAGPPTNLGATSIAPTSALVSWTNGDTSTGTTTVVQYRITGLTSWTTASGAGLPAGQSSLTLSGLHCATSYDVNVFHRKDGIDSAAITLTLFTTAACQISGLAAPSDFHPTSCTLTLYGGKQYATYGTQWTPGTNPPDSIFQIAEALSNNPAVASVVRTGPIARTSQDIGAYLVTPTAAPRYFWIRHVDNGQASIWTALVDNPIQIKDGCIA